MNWKIVSGFKVAGPIVALAALAYPSCRPENFDLLTTCEEKQVIGGMSPNGQYSAIVYLRSCGATTGWSTFITVFPNSQKFKGGGKDVIYGIDGLYGISVIWLDDTHLRVDCIRCDQTKIFKQDSKWRDVTVSYESYGSIPSPSSSPSKTESSEKPN
jgi:hypothetical protein